MFVKLGSKVINLDNVVEIACGRFEIKFTTHGLKGTQPYFGFDTQEVTRDAFLTICELLAEGTCKFLSLDVVPTFTSQ